MCEVFPKVGQLSTTRYCYQAKSAVEEKVDVRIQGTYNCCHVALLFVEAQDDSGEG